MCILVSMPSLYPKSHAKQSDDFLRDGEPATMSRMSPGIKIHICRLSDTCWACGRPKASSGEALGDSAVSSAMGRGSQTNEVRHVVAINKRG